MITYPNKELNRIFFKSPNILVKQAWHIINSLSVRILSEKQMASNIYNQGSKKQRQHKYWPKQEESEEKKGEGEMTGAGGQGHTLEVGRITEQTLPP